MSHEYLTASWLISYTGLVALKGFWAYSTTFFQNLVNIIQSYLDIYIYRMISLSPKNNLSQKYDRIVYCDMDGVIADFAKKSAELGFPVEPQDKAQPKDEEMWKAIESYGKDKFFADLDWTPEGRKLWDYISDNFINVKILTALGKADKEDKLTSRGKRMWLRRNIPMINDNDIIMVPNKYVKKHYARPGDILIDDTEVCIQGWLRKGGIGILHKNTNNTIQQLEKYV